MTQTAPLSLVDDVNGLEVAMEKMLGWQKVQVVRKQYPTMMWDWIGATTEDTPGLKALREAYGALQNFVPGVLACEDETTALVLLKQMEGLRKLHNIRMV